MINNQSKETQTMSGFFFFDCVIVLLLTDKKYFFNCVRLIEKNEKEQPKLLFDIQ